MVWPLLTMNGQDPKMLFDLREAILALLLALAAEAPSFWLLLCNKV